MSDHAKVLAQRPYHTIVELDRLMSGESVYYVSLVELPGAQGQGATIEQALADLQDAVVELIESLLEDELPVPEPFSETSETIGYETVTISVGLAPLARDDYGQEYASGHSGGSNASFENDTTGLDLTEPFELKRTRVTPGT